MSPRNYGLRRARRATVARGALRHWNSTATDQDVVTAARDLIADLMHLIDLQGADAPSEVAAAVTYYVDERNGVDA